MADQPAPEKSTQATAGWLPEGALTKRQKLLAIAGLGVLAIVVLIFGGTTNATKTPTPQVKIAEPASPSPTQVQSSQTAMAEELARALAERKQAEDLQKLTASLPGAGGSGDNGQLRNQQVSMLNQQAEMLNASRKTGRAASPSSYQPSGSNMQPEGKARSSIAFDISKESGSAKAVQSDEKEHGTAEKDADVLAKATKGLPGPDPALATYILPEGTVLESVLENKLEGSYSGQVKCMLTTATYAPGTRTVVLPKGTIFLGQTSAVSGFGQQRLAMTFHRIIVGTGPNTYAISLDKNVPGLDQQGATAIKDKVNNHWLSTFAVAGAIGAIAGLAQIGNSSIGYGIDPVAQFRVGVTQQTAQAATQILDRFLSRMPTLTVRPGTRVKLMLTADLTVPQYQPQEGS